MQSKETYAKGTWHRPPENPNISTSTKPSSRRLYEVAAYTIAMPTRPPPKAIHTNMHRNSRIRTSCPNFRLALATSDKLATTRRKNIHVLSRCVYEPNSFSHSSTHSSTGSAAPSISDDNSEARVGNTFIVRKPAIPACKSALCATGTPITRICGRFEGLLGCNEKQAGSFDEDS